MSYFIALDLEMNQPSGKIIQVGVAIGKQDHDWREYLMRSWFVDPGEPISDFIIHLTGITDEIIDKEAQPWETIAAELSALLTPLGITGNPVTWGGGDSQCLLEAFKTAGVAFPHFGHRWLDVKTLHKFLLLAKGKTSIGGLSSSMGAYKLPFIGKPHRADDDALNTLRLFFHLLNRQQKLEKVAYLLQGI